MRVLLYEQMHKGHYYCYVHHLLPHLLDITDDVVVAITPEGRQSDEFADQLSPFAGRVAFEATLPSGPERMRKRERFKMHTDLRRAVRHTRPDYVLLPSGDLNVAVMGLFRLGALGGLPGHRPGEVGVHLGWGSGAQTRKESARDHLHALQLALAGWTRVHLVNHLFYEWVQARGGALAASSHLLPHPVQPNTRTREESRRRLGLPEDGRVLGIAGVIDRRKAVGELLQAFRTASTAPTDRLLLAGPLTAPHRRTLAQHEDLVRAGRILVIDRFLDADTHQDALAAMDVVCAPYRDFSGLSSVLLEGMAAGRPILAPARGWCRMLVDRYAAGWTCDISDPTDFARAIGAAFAGCGDHRPSAAAARLLAFHAPDNFARCFLRGLREFAGLPAAPGGLTWSWVNEAAGSPGPSVVPTTGRQET